MKSLYRILTVLVSLNLLAQTVLLAQDSEYQQAADQKISNLDKAQIPTGIPGLFQV